jgi:hypothetical protein
MNLEAKVHDEIVVSLLFGRVLHHLRFLVIVVGFLLVCL